MTTVLTKIINLLLLDQELVSAVKLNFISFFPASQSQNSDPLKAKLNDSDSKHDYQAIFNEGTGQEQSCWSKCFSCYESTPWKRTVDFVKQQITTLSTEGGDHDAALASLKGFAREIADEEIFLTDPNGFLEDNPFDPNIVQIGGTCWIHGSTRVLQAYIPAQFKTISVRNLLPHDEDVHQTLVNLALGASENSTHEDGGFFPKFLYRVGPILGTLLVIFAQNDEQRTFGTEWMNNHGLLQLCRGTLEKDQDNLVPFTEEVKGPYFYHEDIVAGCEHATVLIEPMHAADGPGAIEDSKWRAVNTWPTGCWSTWSQPWQQRRINSSNYFEVDLSPSGMHFSGWDWKLWCNCPYVTYSWWDWSSTVSFRQLWGLADVGSLVDDESLKTAIGRATEDRPQELKRLCELFGFEEGVNLMTSERSFFHAAATERDPFVIQEYFELGANSNLRHPVHKNTPLHFAAYHGKLENCRVLLDLGADISLQDVDGETALDFAQHRLKQEQEKEDQDFELQNSLQQIIDLLSSQSP